MGYAQMRKKMEKLRQIQFKLKAPKGQLNKFGNYHYRSCEDILEAVKPLLEEFGCLLTISDDIQMIGDRIYVKATATIDDGENQYSVSAFAREAATKKGMDDSQITGTASSYARKYALNGLFLIDDTKDADTMDNRPTAQNNQQPGKIKDYQTETLNKFIPLLIQAGEPDAAKTISANLATWSEAEAASWINGIKKGHPEW